MTALRVVGGGRRRSPVCCFLLGAAAMSKLRVSSFSVSIDGFGAGPAQSLEHPLGRGGEALHDWVLPTRTFQRMMFGKEGGTTGVDDDFAARGFANVGAWILGRNMFGPIRGPWPDDAWKGWWGDEPAVPRAGVRADPPSARAARDGGRHDLPLRHRRHPRGAGARARRGRRQRRPHRRRRRDDPRSTCEPASSTRCTSRSRRSLLGGGEALLAGIDLPALGFEPTRHAARRARCTSS